MVLFQRQTSNSSAELNVGYGADERMDANSSSHQTRGRKVSPSPTAPARHNKSFQQGSNFLGSRPAHKIHYDIDAESASGSFTYWSEKRESKRSITATSAFNAVKLIAIVVICFFYITSHRALNAKNTELSTLYADFNSLEVSLGDTEHELDRAHEDFHMLQMRMLAGQVNVPGSHYSGISDGERKDIANGILDKHDQQSERIAKLQKSIKDIHRAELDRR